MSKVGRNDACHCGSGLKYKRCHMNADNVGPAQRLNKEYEEYLDKWSANSTAFESQGCYAWMASIALRDNPEKALDVGCGDGRGLLAVLEKNTNPNLKIVGIDENTSCINASAARLREKGYTVEVLERATTRVAGDSHRFTFNPIKTTLTSQVTLFQSDLLSDEMLEPFLSVVGSFDLITVWLIGTHFQRSSCQNIRHLNISTSGNYRLSVQNKTYELADRILKKGGILQVVDRGEVPDSEFLKNDSLNSHKEQASVTRLVVENLEFVEYLEPNAARRIAMVETAGLSGRKPDLTRVAMTSVVSRR